MKPLNWFRFISVLFLVAYLSQSFVVVHHTVKHLGEKIAASQQASTVMDHDCPICDSDQVTPQVPQIVVALKVAPLIQSAPSLPPIFTSDNAILLPFGARAPPSIGC